MEPYTIDSEAQHPNTIRILDQFDAYRIAYKHVNSHPIYAFFIIPKGLPSGPRPLLVRFHGGAWTEGEAEASMRPFFLELAQKHGAVIMTPDYRLRPEHQMTDALDDSRSFWRWVEQGEAAKVLHDSLGIELDAGNLLVGGESGGGYHAAQTALLGMTGSLPIKVLFLQYPGFDIESFTKLGRSPGDGEEEEESVRLLRQTFDTANPVPYSVVEEHLAALEPGAVCSRAKFGSRMHLFEAMVLAGRLCDVSGDNGFIDPMKSIETAGKLPPILLYHSKEDTSVPWQQTEAWAAKLKRLQPDVPLFLSYQTGDHVFDKNDSMATPWLKEPLEFVHKYWPA